MRKRGSELAVAIGRVVAEHSELRRADIIDDVVEFSLDLGVVARFDRRGERIARVLTAIRRRSTYVEPADIERVIERLFEAHAEPGIDRRVEEVQREAVDHDDRRHGEQHQHQLSRRRVSRAPGTSCAVHRRPDAAGGPRSEGSISTSSAALAKITIHGCRRPKRLLPLAASPASAAAEQRQHREGRQQAACDPGQAAGITGHIRSTTP